MIVDVRDDALCHVRMLESVHVQNGERYIAWSTETANVEEVAELVGNVCPTAEIQVRPMGTTSNPTQGGAPDPAQEAALRRIWTNCDLRNDRIVAATGVTFRPIAESVRDCVESLLSVGEVVPDRKPPGYRLTSVY